VLALFGIPIFGMMLDSIISTVQMVIYIMSQELSRLSRRFQWKLRFGDVFQTSIAITLTVAIVLIGAEHFGVQFIIESYGEAIYFILITLTTIGFGDYHPPVEEDIYVRFTVLLCFGMATIGLVFGAVLSMYEFVAQRIRKCCSLVPELQLDDIQDETALLSRYVEYCKANGTYDLPHSTHQRAALAKASIGHKYGYVNPRSAESMGSYTLHTRGPRTAYM